MSTPPPASPAPPRAVAPLSIVAEHLAALSARAAELGYDDPAFRGRLARAERLASGLEPYLAACTAPASEPLRALAADTARRDWSGLHRDARTAVPLEREMISGHIEGAFLALLVRATRARRVLEIGLFTGYSALAMAEALPPEGRLVACEIDAYAASVAREGFDRSPHGAKIAIAVGPAAETLARMAAAGERFDLVFVDADKGGYAGYFERLVGADGLLADEGLICVDNTLMQGEPYAGGDPDGGPRTGNGEAIAAFNAALAADPRVEAVMLPLRDGVTLVRRAAAP